MQQVLRIIYLASYAAGLIALAVGTVNRFFTFMQDVSPRGMFIFAMACLICSIATLRAAEEEAKERQKPQEKARSATA